jgi:hypothetical protein
MYIRNPILVRFSKDCQKWGSAGKRIEARLRAMATLYRRYSACAVLRHSEAVHDVLDKVENSALSKGSL